MKRGRHCCQTLGCPATGLLAAANKPDSTHSLVALAALLQVSAQLGVECQRPKALDLQKLPNATKKGLAMPVA